MFKVKEIKLDHNSNSHFALPYLLKQVIRTLVFFETLN